jgi:hypothetical protein
VTGETTVAAEEPEEVAVPVAVASKVVESGTRVRSAEPLESERPLAVRLRVSRKGVVRSELAVLKPIVTDCAVVALELRSAKFTRRRSPEAQVPRLTAESE